MKNKTRAVTQYILQGGVRWCANCGFSFRSSVSFGDRNALRNPPRQHVPTVTANIKMMSNINNASIIKRFINWTIDSLVVGLLWLGLFILIGKLIAQHGVPSWIKVGENYDMSLSVFIPLIPYYLIFEGVFKTTIGKLITRTKIIDLNGNDINFYHACIRTLCRLIPLEPISYLYKNDYGWHDSISKTRVINKTKIKSYE